MVTRVFLCSVKFCFRDSCKGVCEDYYMEAPYKLNIEVHTIKIG